MRIAEKISRISGIIPGGVPECIPGRIPEALLRKISEGIPKN